MATGDIVKLGTLYMGGVKVLRPTKPWSAKFSEGSSGYGDLREYVPGSTIEIKNTDANDAYAIQWVEVNDSGRKYLIADRNLLEGLTWSELNTQGLLTGKMIVINNERYKLRVLTGGNDSRSNSYEGGRPTNNEWDRFIKNEQKIPQLPIPNTEDLNTVRSQADLLGVHNKLWNWWGIFSGVAEEIIGEYSAARGNISAAYHATMLKIKDTTPVGYRPLLEFLGLAPIIIGPSASLGNKSTTFSFNYSATDADNESITSKVTLNGTTIDTATSATGNIATRTVTIPQNVWDALTINTAYTITITVTDAKGETATSTHTFTKVNAAPTAQIVEPKGDAINVPIVDKIQPILVWNFKDTDIADVQSAYRVVVEDLNGLVVHDSLKKTGTASYYQVPVNLEWTKTYKWKVTVWDRYDVPSNVSEYGFFKPNRAPNLTGITPGSTDKLLPSKVGSTPVYTWTFEDLDVEAQAAYQLQIFQTADDAIVYNTNRVSKNVQTHTIPDNVLLPGVGYYAILTVWDPNNLSATSEKLYIATNATPSAPTLTRPIDNFRTPIKPVLAAVIGTDPENDKQHFKVQLSQDKDFASGVVEFSSLTSRVGWKVDGFDIPVEGVDNSSAGKSVELTLQTNLEKNKTYYWRMAAIDNNTKAVGKYSAARKIRVGNRIEYNTLKRQIPTEATAARRILVALDYTLAKDGATPSTIRVYVSNNALDVTPTWEDATTEFLRQDYYTFKNATKTAAKFGVGVKVVIQANDSMEPISINAAGITFD